MFSLLGAPALSQFRLDKLLQSLQGPGVRGRRGILAAGPFRRRGPPLDESELEVAREIADLWSATACAGGARPEASRDAPPRHRVALVEQGHRHRQGVRARRRAAAGARHGVLHRAPAPLSDAELESLGALLHDRMTESLWIDTMEPEGCFSAAAPRPLRVVTLGRDGHAALARANAEWGLALSERGDRLSGGRLRQTRAGSHRCRAHDVRAGEFRALPAQDIQCRVHRRRCADAACRCSG